MKKLKQAQAKTKRLFLFGIALFIAVMCYGSTETVSQGTKATVVTAALFMSPCAIKLAPEPDGPNDGLSDKEKAMAEITKNTKKQVEDLLKENKLVEKFGLLDDLKKSWDEKIKTFKTEEDFKKLEKEIGDYRIEVKAMQDASKQKLGGETAKQQIFKFIEDNKDKISTLKKQGHGNIEFTIKAADVMTTASATNPDGIPELVGVQMAPPTRVNLRTAIVRELVTTLATSLAAYPYTESVPKDGDYSFVAEKGTKPLIDFKIETRYAVPYKIAAHMELTEEAVTDIPGLQSIAYDYLRSKHDLKWQNGVLFGNGNGTSGTIPKGALNYGRSFVAGSMAQTVNFTNFMDVVNAAITDIFTTHNFTDEVPYMANLVMVNPIDFFTQLVAAKDERGLPLYPTASLFNRVTLGGVTIIPFEDIPAGKIFVADMSKYNVTNYVGYTVRIGWINDQFITNQFCIVGESRFHAFVKKLDQQAFIYDDIATIKSAISAP